MSFLNSISKPSPHKLLISFTDLTLFTRFCLSNSDKEVFSMIRDFFHFHGHIIENQGGEVIKHIGDASLIAFPEERVEEGILALRELKNKGDHWLMQRNIKSRVMVKVHFDEVIVGEIGTPSWSRVDIYGKGVNTTATLPCKGFTLTPQAFRKLSSESRKFFKKHTEPITYIPLEESHGRHS